MLEGYDLKWKSQINSELTFETVLKKHTRNTISYWSRPANRTTNIQLDKLKTSWSGVYEERGKGKENGRRKNQAASGGQRETSKKKQ